MKNRAKTIMTIFLVLVMISIAFSLWWFWVRTPNLPEGLIQANGRIEGEHYIVASKMPGRIKELSFREGDQVTEGQVLVLFDDTQVNAKLEQAHQGLMVAQASLNAAITQEKQAVRSAQRLHALFLKGSVTEHENEQAELALALAKNQLDAAKAQRNQAEAILAEAQCILDDLTVRAPANGIVTSRVVNEGGVVAAGSPLLDIVDLDRLYLKVYIPEKEIGKVRLNLPAQVYIDAYPDQHYPATLRYISSRAEFTPKEVQTPDERVKLVYAVKLFLDKNPDHRLTPGLPADAIIRWQEDAPWAKPRW